MVQRSSRITGARPTESQTSADKKGNPKSTDDALEISLCPEYYKGQREQRGTCWKYSELRPNQPTGSILTP